MTQTFKMLVRLVIFSGIAFLLITAVYAELASYSTVTAIGRAVSIVAMVAALSYVAISMHIGAGRVGRMFADFGRNHPPK